MADLESWLQLAALRGLTRSQKRRWLQQAAPQQIIESLQAGQLPGFFMGKCERFAPPPVASLEQALTWQDNSPSRHIITLMDEAYPQSLRVTDDPPLLLFVEGQLTCLSAASIALVGARKASHVGRQLAFEWSQQLASSGWGITSGLALGIDGASHQGALAGGGATSAVLGSGLSNVYPRQHRSLATQIIEQGALVSEYWPNQPPLRHHFPERNRIVSGLSYGLVVIEAGLKSGSLISARLAAEQGREVFAVPGSVLEPNRQGCHQLIQQGAKLVTDPVDIIEELTLQRPYQPSLLAAKLPDSPLLDSVGYEVTPVDVVVQRSELPVEVVMTQLTELELDGVVAAVPGGYVRLKGG
ncbi:DNA-processing protein DprA [Ferrimonas senticii]|uniref:DNA-processing protein DprA n=1 Tax=Ferrimonas senticii TaxID=394566 RepID=UPI0004255113|nr:DNA-processing protein DprA [Ferrimonas senticii]